MTLNGVMAVTLRYFTVFGKPAFQDMYNRVDLWRNLCTSLLYFVVRVLFRRKESSRSLSHLLMSFLYYHCFSNDLDTVSHLLLALPFNQFPLEPFYVNGNSHHNSSLKSVRPVGWLIVTRQKVVGDEAFVQLTDQWPQFGHLGNERQVWHRACQLPCLHV